MLRPPDVNVVIDALRRKLRCLVKLRLRRGSLIEPRALASPALHIDPLDRLSDLVICVSHCLPRSLGQLSLSLFRLGARHKKPFLHASFDLVSILQIRVSGVAILREHVLN